MTNLPPKLQAAAPREWWIDDVTQRVCGPWNDPEIGVHTMAWPDNEKVIHVIEKAYADKLAAELAVAERAIRELRDMPVYERMFELERQLQVERERADENDELLQDEIALNMKHVQERDEARAEVEQLRQRLECQSDTKQY